MTNEHSNKNVHGTVSDGRNNKLANLLVKAFDRDMRSEGFLGECVTDAKGAYTISYTAEQYSPLEKQTADLAVKVYSGGGKTLLYETDLDHVVFNASDDETIDVVISAEIKPEENEFDHIEREISRLIGEVKISELQNNDEHRDITFLSKETGISAEKLEHFVVAARINAESEIDAAFFYGLIRKNTLLKKDFANIFQARLSIEINTDLKPLVYEAALADVEIVRSDLAAAVEEMIVPASVLEVSEKYIDLLREYAGEAEEYYKNEQPRKVLDIITRFVLEDKIGEVVRIFQDNKNDLQGFLKKITDASFFASESEALSAKTSLALSELIGFDERIISQVSKSQKIKKPEDIQKLAALNKADWKRVLTASANKMDIAGKKLNKKLINFHASALARKMEKEFPSVAFTAQLEREKKPVLENHKIIKGFLKKNADFDLKSSNIDLFLKEKNLTGKKNEPMRAELKAVQRVFKLVPHYSKTNSLLQKNIHSAQSIAAIGESRFVKEIAPEAGIGKKEAIEIFKKAESTNTAAMLLVGELQNTRSAMDISALQVPGVANKLEAISKDFPDLKTLFQLTDVCACEHCRSVYSPAAYLVEILEFLDKRNVIDLTVTPHVTNRNAKESLFFHKNHDGSISPRRADLGDIDLGCENANTPIPYIDLVCELLEEAVAPDAGINYTGALSDGPDPLRGKISEDLFNTLTNAGFPVTIQALIFETETTSGSSATKPHYLRDTKTVCVIHHNGGNNYTVKQLHQTLSSAEELAAAPAYVNDKAYDLLKSEKYAFKLPFDLYQTEAKAYFSRFDIERHVLMSDFQVPNVPADQDIAAEHLGLTKVERELIVDPDPNNQKKYWNTTTSNVPKEMKIVDTFLTKSGLAYKELELLLLLKFIDPFDNLPTNNLFIKHNYDDPNVPQPTISCDTTKKEIANLDDVALDRIHRFLRWQKKTGWKFETLDEIIMQPKLGNGKLDADDDDNDGISNGNECLIKAAVLKRLSEKTEIKLEELIGFFGVIPHEELSPDAQKPLYHQIFLNKAKNGFIEEGLLPENVDGIKPLSDFKTSISVCLQISEQDFDKLLPTVPNGNLTFANLSSLYAASLLMRKLKLKVNDFIILTELTGIDIQSSPEETLEFVEAAIASRKFPLKLADLKFMLRHEAENIDDRKIKDDKVKQILEKLQAEYQKAFTANRSPYDHTLTADEQKETLQNLLSKLPGIEEGDLTRFAGLIDGNWIDCMDEIETVDCMDETGIHVESNDVAEAFAYVKSKIGKFLNVDQIEDIRCSLKSLKIAICNANTANSAEEAAVARIAAARQALLTAITEQEIDEAEAELAAALAAEEITAAAAKDANDDVKNKRNALIKNLLDPISEYFFKAAKKQALLQTLAASFKTAEELVEIVINHAQLKQPLPPPGIFIGDVLQTDDLIDKVNTPPVLPTIDEGKFLDQFNSIRLLHKLFPFINSFKLENENVEWHLKNNASLEWFELDGIPYQTGPNIVDYPSYAAFADIVSIGKELTPVPNPADAGNPIIFYTLLDMLLPLSMTLRPEFITAFSLLTGYEKDDVEAIDDYLFPGVDDLDDYRDVETWKSIEKMIRHLRKLGSTVDQVVKFIKPELIKTDIDFLRMALKARYDEESWLNTLKQITDAIRPQKRNALVAYLLATNPEMKDENYLYDYFLVDTEMESCMPSSRIVLAHGTTQLFVQRCLMGLEPTAAADVSNDGKWTQWKWMKNYRVWEANRKVFLYPENWIEAELRDDKSFLFQELEDELLQNELNNSTAEEALIKYLEKLDNIAFLEVVATWYETDISTMHVFARTKGGDPPIYYYRQFKEEKYWTPWEKVELDITGDHLLAFVRNNRLCLAWLVFSEEQKPDPKVKIPGGGSGEVSVPLDKPFKKLKIHLAISEYANGTWQPKKISHDAILTPKEYTNGELPKDKYNMLYLESAEQVLFIETNYDPPEEFHQTVGVFNIIGCKGYPELVPIGDTASFDFLPDFKDAPLYLQRYKELNQDRGFVPVGTFNKIVVQPDGKALVGGNFRVAGNNVYAGLFRLNADGTFDTGFQPPAFYNASGIGGTINAIALQQDGKILVGGDFQGASSISKRAIMRLNADGSIDLSFNVQLDDIDAVNVVDIRVLPDTHILIGGNFGNINGVNRAGIARLNSDGSLDSPFYQIIDTPTKLAPQPDGKLVVGYNNYVRRFNSDGTLDTSFSALMIQGGSVLDMHLQPDGKILVAGTFTQVNGVNRRALFRINSDASIDTTFNSGGAGLGNGGVKGITPKSDGKFLVFGSFTNYNSVARNRAATINADGTLDMSFTYTGALTLLDMAFLPNGKILVGGTTSLARINADGSPDPTFVVSRQDDLSVKNAFSPNQFLELLSQTPGTFRITYPHQLTATDYGVLLFQYLSRHAAGGVGKYGSFAVPRGCLLPYFMEDGNHAYVIIPGFYYEWVNRTWHTTTAVKRTASDALQLIDDMTVLADKYVALYNADPDKNVNALMEKLSTDNDYQDIVKEMDFYSSLRYAEYFKNMYHPLVCPLRTILYQKGIPELMKRETQLQTTAFDFNTHYQPTNRVPTPHPIEDIDFSSDGSYSLYNWELFFHIPFLMATRLSQNQRFEEAMDWFHYMFDPTGALEGDVPQKYWMTKPFYETMTADYISQRIDTLLRKIANPATYPWELDNLKFAVEEWRDKPFMPHVVARFRPVAYQKALLMKYIDNLIEWGDYLFRQDTMESIVQATQMYILADKLLGAKPRTIPPPIKAPYETYNQIEAKIDAFGNALIDLENILPDLSVLPEGGAELPPPPITLSMLYFCIPQNDKMLEYWDRVADRLFKIRNCQNIEGIERSLALFAPPIDPGMLVRAAASGLDISSILAGINAPTPFYRFNVLSQKATELVQEVRGLGNSLLQALEKKDAEVMALLRSELEIKVLNAVRDMKELQKDEAVEQVEVLRRTKAVTEERHKYYRDIEFMNPLEVTALVLNGVSIVGFTVGSIMEMTAGATALIPDVMVGASGFGGSPHVVSKVTGGEQISKSVSSFAKAILLGSQIIDKTAAGISTMASYQRRDDDWKLQERLAEKELAQIDRQIVAAEIRAEIAETDLKNHDLQTANAIETDKFMRTKFTNKQLYDWMIGQISSVYFRSYKLAHDFAKKAERCYRFELGNDDTFIDFGYWDTMKKGLQSADRLLHDVKRMETGYLDKNKREYEVTKHVSLAMLDPLALIMLRATGACNFEIPEAIYDMDHPGHYFRRVKSVSVSLPCIAGPYTSVSAKLSLVSNKYRKTTAGTGYGEDLGNDERFTYNVGAIQSIAASNSQNDSGMFELNFRDERYLPFEGCGAIGTWRLELPKEVRQFDYNTISDVVLHVKYTSREGGSTLRGLAEETLREKLQEIKQRLSETGLHIALNMKHELPNEWHLLKTNGEVDLTINKSRLPYFVQSLAGLDIENVIFIARVQNNPPSFSINISTNNVEIPLNLSRINDWKMCVGNKPCVGNNEDIDLETSFELSVTQPQLGALEDMMIIVKVKFDD